MIEGNSERVSGVVKISATAAAGSATHAFWPFCEAFYRTILLPCFQQGGAWLCTETRREDWNGGRWSHFTLMEALYTKNMRKWNSSSGNLVNLIPPKSFCYKIFLKGLTSTLNTPVNQLERKRNPQSQQRSKELSK